MSELMKELERIAGLAKVPTEGLILAMVEACQSLEKLRDEVVAGEEHGEGAYDEACPTCAAVKHANVSLSNLKKALSHE